MTNCIISVLVLSYNHVDYIEKSIKSIFNQKIHLDSIEIIVTDDGSTDGTTEVLEEIKSKSPLPMCIILKEHRGITGISKSFNEMIELARGKYIAFLSADDEYCPDRFRNQIKLLEENPMAKIIHSNGTNVKNGIKVSTVLSDNICNVLKAENPYELYSHITQNNDPLYMQGLLIDSEFLKKFDPFDPELINDDWIFNIKSTQSLCKNGFTFKFLNQQVFIRNLLPNSTSNISAHHIPRVLGVINKYCKSSSRSKLKMKIYLNQAIISFKNKKFKFIIFTLYSIINGASFVGRELLKMITVTDARRNN